MICDTCTRSVYEGYGLMFAKAFPEMGPDESVRFWCCDCVPPDILPQKAGEVVDPAEVVGPPDGPFGCV